MPNEIDLLNREKFIEDVIKLVNQLSENSKGCCFAIEGGWGIGKTFVIEKIEEQLERVQSEKENGDKYFVVHYNCWKYDYYEEPSVAIISAMLASIKEDKAIVSNEVDQNGKAVWGVAKKNLTEIVGLCLKNKIGINLVELVKEVDDIKKENEKAEFEYDKMFNFSQTIDEVRKRLADIAKERTIVLCVDELDRCIPSYAIKVLERLHHIFYGLKNVVVIMAIDRVQLEHSVEEMFGCRKDGTSIDIERYLKKFIDFSMVLDNGVVNESFREKFEFYYDKFSNGENSSNVEALNEMLPKLFEGIDIRRQEKIIEKANIVHSIICDKEPDISVMAFEIMYEVLRLWKFGDMSCVVTINTKLHEDLENRIGKEKIQLLKEMEEKACDGSFHGGGNKKRFLENLYGKVFWYFANLFNDKHIPYVCLEGYEKELEVVKEYCEYGKMIK